MADQKRWFKVWTSILDDPDFQELSLEDIGRWALLGAMTALVGTKGILATPSGARRLCQLLRVDSTADLKRALSRIPNLYLGDGPIHWPHGHDKPPVVNGVAWRGSDPVSGGVGTLRVAGYELFDAWCMRNGSFAVTWKNWQKYQEDSTAAARGRALRSKRRGEERRGEEISAGVVTSPITSSERRIERFEEFWRIYPRKVGKAAAVKAWGKLTPANGLVEILLAAVDRQRQSAQWQDKGGRFIPHPATWINGRRWEDETGEEFEEERDPLPRYENADFLCDGELKPEAIQREKVRLAADRKRRGLT